MNAPQKKAGFRPERRSTEWYYSNIEKSAKAKKEFLQNKYNISESQPL
jgi:DNA-dependent RNA polymerase auxiliary subunit epsilon